MMFTDRAINQFVDLIDVCPWATVAGSHSIHARVEQPRKRPALYTPEQRLRRDASGWTVVQGILAPAQFLVFLISLFFVVRYLLTGQGLEIATTSVVVKTLTLYAIMVTGAIWEREVFGQYLFAPAFFWEDVFSFLVLALHSAYLFALFSGSLDPEARMHLALAAYAAYAVNATQFLLKLRAARLDKHNGSRLPNAIGVSR